MSTITRSQYNRIPVWARWAIDLAVRAGRMAIVDDQPPAVVPPSIPLPSPTPTGGALIFAQQQLFCGCQYFWPSLDANSFCRDAAASGFSGVHCELMALRTTGDFATVQQEQIAKLRPWADACRKWGLILFVTGWNTNDTLAPKATQEIMGARFDGLKGLGTDGILLQPMSEDDNRTDPGLRAWGRHYAAAIWPTAQLAKYAGQGGGAFNESHSDGNVDAGWRGLFVTDNGSQKWGQMANADFVAMAIRHVNAGHSFCIYGFQTVPDWTSWKPIADAYRAKTGGAVNPPPSAQGDALDASKIVGWYKRGSLPSLASMAVLGSVTAKIDATRISYGGNPFTPTSHAAIIWQEIDTNWYWTNAEWMNDGATSQNWQRNVEPQPGISTDAAGRQHRPIHGSRIYACITSGDNKSRTAIVDAGILP